jgi:hypothetical protein
MGRAYSTHGKNKKCMLNSVGKCQGKKYPWRIMNHWDHWEGNIKMDHRYIDFEDVDKLQWHAFVIKVIKPQVP